MPATSIRGLSISPPLMNSSSAWASDKKQLTDLYNCTFTGAVTTRTATLTGFKEDARYHTVAFAKSSQSSVNSYGYSPYPLSQYLTWVEELLSDHRDSEKPIIISITSSSPTELHAMIDSIQDLRRKLSINITPPHSGSSHSRIAIEINTSCPNIVNSPPPAYDVKALTLLLVVLADHHFRDPTLVIGLKLPPYVVASQISDVVNAVAEMTEGVALPESFIAFLTCTNTLGMNLLFSEDADTRANTDSLSSDPPPASPFALPSPLGGLAGDALHTLALGNVYAFANLLANSPVEQVRRIAIVGVGGVTSRNAVQRMRHAGASVVACATFYGKHGIDAFRMLSE